jgi:hypothetical protein
MEIGVELEGLEVFAGKMRDYSMHNNANACIFLNYLGLKLV